MLPTDLVTSNTRLVLQNRFDRKQVTEPLFFDADSFLVLHAVCKRLIPQSDPDRMVDVAGCLDDMLAEGKGNGWRYDAMPADEKAFTSGLTGIDQTAVSKYGQRFHFLLAKEQDEILASIQSGATADLTWQTLPATLFFEELLAALVEIFYSHPFAKEEIGEVAFADAKGWQKIGLHELEDHEPKPIKETLHAGQ